MNRRVSSRRRGALFVVLVGAILLCLGAGAQADIYWGSHRSGFDSGIDSLIGHARLDGSEVNHEFLDIKAEVPARFAADGAYLYSTFPGPGGGSIGRVRLDGSEPNPDFIVGPGPGPLSGVKGIAVTSQYVYWTNGFDAPEGAGGEIGRARIDGSEVNEDYISTGEKSPAGDLAISGSHLYWDGEKGIGRVNVNGTELNPEFIPQELNKEDQLGFIWGLAANSEYVYWTRDEFGEHDPGDGIGRASVNGGEVDPDFITELEGTQAGIAVDPQHIYWSNNEGESIGRATLAGGSVEEDFISGVQEPEGITVDHRIVIDSTAEYKDASPGDGICAAEAKVGGVCTLRAAIEEVNAEHKSAPVPVSVEIPGGKLETVALKEALPKIESPIELDARSQPGAFSVEDPYTGKPHKIGVIVDGSSLGAGANGIQLAAGATGSTISGLQIQNFKGDGVLLEAENSQLSDSILYLDQVGAEVSANGDLVGAGNGLEGDIFFRDGQLEGTPTYLESLNHSAGLATVDKALREGGSGVLLTKASKGARIMGNWIGIHGEGFSTGADQLPADGINSLKLGEVKIMPIGIAVVPSSGEIENVTVGGAGREGRNVISGTLFGILSGAPEGTFVQNLSIAGNTIGPDASGSKATGLFGTLFGVLASGNIGGLQVGGSSVGNNFAGDLLAVTLTGEEMARPSVQGNIFGNAEAVGNVEHGIGLINGFGVLMAETQGAQIGGLSAGQGNTFHGDAIGLGMFGEHLKQDTVAGNTIGNAPAKTFTTFLKEPDEFNVGFGLLAVGNATAGKSSASQELVFQGNTFQANVIAALTLATTGTSFVSNTLQNDALGAVDLGSGATKIGEAGKGNSFLDDGIGLLQSNFEPNAAELNQAQVNPEDTSAKTRHATLGAPDENLAFDGIDAITTADLSANSAEPPSTPGQHNSIVANRFGLDAEGHAQPDELPAMILGDEHEERFGGTAPGEGNVVEDNRDDGLLIASIGAEHDPTVQVLGNTIYNNENFTGSLVGFPGLGIDLDGETPGFGPGVNNQDPRQPDPTGPNNFQNSPVLSAAGSEDGTLTVAGSLHGAPSTNYLLEVFADENKNPFGAGEGQTLLGRVSLTTDAAGNVGFTAGFADPGAAYRYVSSTATTVPPLGDAGVTSEFSVDVAIVRATSPGPGPIPVEPAKGAAKTTVETKGSTATTGTTSVTLPAKASCSSATATPCTVTITATIPATASKASIAAYVAVAKKKSPVAIGHGTMTLAHGASAALRMTLTKSGFALLRKRHTLAVTVTVRIAGHGRPTITRTLHFKLKYKKPAKRR